jgi:hypothetical protein
MRINADIFCSQNYLHQIFVALQLTPQYAAPAAFIRGHQFIRVIRVSILPWFVSPRTTFILVLLP